MQVKNTLKKEEEEEKVHFMSGGFKGDNLCISKLQSFNIGCQTLRKIFETLVVVAFSLLQGSGGRFRDSFPTCAFFV